MNQYINEYLDKRCKEYEGKLNQYGDNSLSMNMRAINQYAGFISMTEDVDFDNKSILDIGCGLGHFVHFLKLKGVNNYTYYGVDIVDQFINIANEKYPFKHIKFRCENFLEGKYDKVYDIIIGNQIFYRKIKGIDTFDYIKEVMNKAFNICNGYMMFNFLSAYAEIQYEENYYVKPEKLLDFAYSLSKNVTLKNNYSPYEFTITIGKEQDIHVRPTYFESFARKNREMLKQFLPEV